MRRERAARHRPAVLFPSQLVLRHPFQQPPRGGHFVVVVRQQPVSDRHQESLPNPKVFLGVPASLWPLLLCVLCPLCAATACRRESPKPPALVPQLSGTLTASGLTASVRIVRDTWGVPHVYASNQTDLFFAQGFVQAQDRLFQMDLWRRASQGRLSEVLGPNFIERDAMTRRIQYRGELAPEWASYGPEAKTIAESFVRGINAWVALARQRPPEAFVLAGWLPETWVAADLLNRTDAFTGSGDALDEIFRARLTAAAGAAGARARLPGDR